MIMKNTYKHQRLSKLHSVKALKRTQAISNKKINQSQKQTPGRKPIQVNLSVCRNLVPKPGALRYRLRGG